METVIILLALFGIKHFLADFLWQFDFMIRDKGRYGAEGGMTHAMLHGVLTFFVLIGFVRPEDAVTLALMDSAIHYHVDWAKTNLSRGLTIEDHKFWVWFGLDQTLHYLTYIAIIAIIVL
ncbi:Bacteriophage phiKZ, Orf197 [uncultured Caudovirales phage]|uniref:Bacteriophage phiKZ, Orf197 n=1 Tax=uncultured Caudovirales phage TaxID=2100421 RepID=A0A6J5LU59_9CAUD|nr:Bacteriophage phiKZ, Orf197 [uncultured Caudovirales phage]